MESLTSPVDHDHRYQIGDDPPNSDPHEYTPLLPRPRPSRSRTFAPIFISLMLIMVLVGVIIGIYLLVEQDREWPVSLPFDMVFRTQWGARNPTRSEAKLSVIPATHVILTHTGTETCSSFSFCSKILLDLQFTYQNRPHNMSDIPFNFLVGSDGETYEGRGFDIVGNIDPAFNNRSISVGFIGNFTHVNPSANQLNEVMSFIIESIRRSKITPTYRVIGRAFEGNPTALFEIVKNWKHWSKI